MALNTDAKEDFSAICVRASACQQDFEGLGCLGAGACNFEGSYAA